MCFRYIIYDILKNLFWNFLFFFIRFRFVGNLFGLGEKGRIDKLVFLFFSDVFVFFLGFKFKNEFLRIYSI